MTTFAHLNPIQRFEALSSLIISRLLPPDRIVNLLSPLRVLEAPNEIERNRSDYIRTDECGLIQELVQTIQGLGCLEETFSECLSRTTHIYLLGDEHVGRLLDLDAAPCNDHTHCLDILSNLGLVYRFTAARKFGYARPDLTQIRLNSWGRLLVGQIEENAAFLQKARTRLSEIFWKHRAEYHELVEICSSPARPLATDRLHQLNLSLPLPLVT